MWGRLSKKISAYSSEDQKLINEAYLIAEKFHKGQKRESGDPYISHPVAVAEELIALKLDATSIAAALLHDVIEDTTITKEELKKKVGPAVVKLVDGLTKLERVRFEGFKRKVESTRKMFLAIAEDIRVVIIKLADRLHNMRTIGALRPDKQKRIAEETLELYAPIAYRLGIGEMKGELEDLAFPILFPEEYAWLKKEVREELPKRKQCLGTIAPIVERELKKEGIENFEINFRAKHYYSLWKKLQRYNLDLSKVTDLVALRIIVESPEDCYRVLGIIHMLWRPLPGRIKDYIAMPKPNGYQSLHTTVFCEHNVIAEFQIRTKKMHEEAEFGIAAHWLYDEYGKPKKGVRGNVEKTSWVKKLQEWQREFAPSDSEEFIEALKIDFFKDRIFVLTPKGEAIDLPEGSTPVDFAYHVHSEIGDHKTGAKVNGKMVSFLHTLVSGDTVEIITQKNKRPSMDLLSMARTASARGHIRSALRKLGIKMQTKNPKKAKTKEITFRIVRTSRIGLLKDIATLFSKENVDILKTDSDITDVNKPHLVIRCRIPRGCDLERLMVRLRRIKGVNELEIKA